MSARKFVLVFYPPKMLCINDLNNSAEILFHRDSNCLNVHSNAKISPGPLSYLFRFKEPANILFFGVSIWLVED